MSLLKVKSEFYNLKANEYRMPFTKGSLYDKINRLLVNGQIILDVGSANGSFSRVLKKRKNKVYGIEISDTMAKISKKYLDEVIVGDIEELKVLPWKKNYFDTILLMDIVEHLFNPDAVFKKIRPHVKKSGQIIVTLPNVANWEIRKNLLLGNFKYEKSGIMDSGHIRFFTYDTALSMFNRNSYVTVHVDCVIKLPLFLIKINNRLPFLGIHKLCSGRYKKLFAYQFIFVLKRV
ncbi:MAG TPA: class I SAM-dependent methyltransferase [Candidatus Sulfotelmatobacter sp.]|nr:class I SAM-dependent methyltransferase [Candidatus Sulfotelmatobacter sp.]